MGDLLWAVWSGLLFQWKMTESKRWGNICSALKCSASSVQGAINVAPSSGSALKHLTLKLFESCAPTCTWCKYFYMMNIKAERILQVNLCNIMLSLCWQGCWWCKTEMFRADSPTELCCVNQGMTIHCWRSLYQKRLVTVSLISLTTCLFAECMEWVM